MSDEQTITLDLTKYILEDYSEVDDEYCLYTVVEAESSPARVILTEKELTDIFNSLNFIACDNWSGDFFSAEDVVNSLKKVLTNNKIGFFDTQVLEG